MDIRAYQPGDADALGVVFHRAVRIGALGPYSPKQVAAWSPKPPGGEAWERRLGDARTFVATVNGTPIGFMSIHDKGYLDLAFVVPEHMGQGVAAGIYARLENDVRAHGLTRLTTHASLLAEPFFARQGWHVVKRQTVARHSVDLPNAYMAKPLTSA